MGTVEKRQPPVIGLVFERAPRVVVCLGAHPDDIEVGAAGFLTRLAAQGADTTFRFLIASGDDQRAEEASQSAAQLLGDRVTVFCGGMTDGYLPYSHAAATKDFIKANIGDEEPDLVLAPHIHDRHQDHRFVGGLAHQIFRKQMILEYEIVKLEGDLGQPAFYVPLSTSQAHLKVDHLTKHFASQQGKGWYDQEMFRGLMRLRGIESLAADGYAEAFHTTRIALGEPRER